MRQRTLEIVVLEKCMREIGKLDVATAIRVTAYLSSAAQQDYVRGGSRPVLFTEGPVTAEPEPK